MLKRSKSKETSGGAIIGMGSQTQRINPSAVMNNNETGADAANDQDFGVRTVYLYTNAF